LNAQAVTFNKTYNFIIADGLFNCYATDSGFFFVMLSDNGSNTRNNSIFTKVNENGDTLFTRRFGNTWDDHRFYNLVKASDSTFVFGGYCYSDSSKRVGCKLYYVNAMGDSLSSKFIGDTNGYHYYTSFITQTSDGGFLSTGQYTDSNSVDGDLLIIRMDSGGNFLWRNTFGGAKFDGGYSSIETPDKGFLSLGWTRSFGFGSSTNRDMLLVKWDSVGNKLWHRTYGSVEFDGGTGITATSDGNYLLAGYQGVPVGEIRCWIMKVDAVGNTIWSQTYDSGYGELWWARERFDGSIVAVGSTDDDVLPLDIGYIIKTDALGNLSWNRKFQVNNNYSYFRNIAFTPDSGFICSGFVFQGASMTQDAWLVKLDSMGCDSAGCAAYTSLPEVIHRDAEDVKLYPNPVQEALNVEFNYPYLGGLEWRIIDLKGRLIKSRPEYTEQRLRIPVTELSPGMYILELRTDTGRKTKRFVKE
jgi:Secretion system C-terminal sorting domain